VLCCAVLCCFGPAWDGMGWVYAPYLTLPCLTLSSLVLYVQGWELYVFEDVPHGHLVSIWRCDAQVPRKHDMPTACDVVWG
jgi:hypothetical protein